MLLLKYNLSLVVTVSLLRSFALSEAPTSPDYFIADSYQSQEIAPDRIIVKKLVGSAVDHYYDQRIDLIARPTEPPPEVPSLRIFPRAKRHSLWGFGGALTESCLSLIKATPLKTQRKFEQLLFHKDQGAGLNFVRIPIGGHDFSNGDYSLNDLPPGQTDPLLLRMDFSSLTPVIEWLKPLREKKINIQTMITPWTPPAWMKTPEQLRGGQLRPPYFGVYADYLLKTIEYLERNGLPINYLSALNEPLIAEAKQSWNYPQAFMALKDQWTFSTEHLLPALQQKHLMGHPLTQLLIHDHNWGNAFETTERFEALLTSKEPVLGGMAMHCYSGSYQTQIDFHRRWPHITTFNSECTANIHSRTHDFDFQWWLQNQTIDAIQIGSRGAMGWNLCLNEWGGPHNDGCDNCRGLITITSKTQSLEPNPEYFALAQVARFVEAGARVVHHVLHGTTPLRALTFINEDQSLIVVIRNPSDSPKSIQFHVTESFKSHPIKVPAHSAVTFRLRPSHQS